MSMAMNSGATNMSDIDNRALQIVQERRTEYEKRVGSGQALPDTFQFHINKPDRRERKIGWSWKLDTQEGLKLFMGHQSIVTF